MLPPNASTCDAAWKLSALFGRLWKTCLDHLSNGMAITPKLWESCSVFWGSQSQIFSLFDLFGLQKMSDKLFNWTASEGYTLQSAVSTSQWAGDLPEVAWNVYSMLNLPDMLGVPTMSHSRSFQKVLQCSCLLSFCCGIWSVFKQVWIGYGFVKIGCEDNWSKNVQSVCHVPCICLLLVPLECRSPLRVSKEPTSFIVCTKVCEGARLFRGFLRHCLRGLCKLIHRFDMVWSSTLKIVEDHLLLSRSILWKMNSSLCQFVYPSCTQGASDREAFRVVPRPRIWCRLKTF